jgi:hypothetical protein
MALFVPVAIGLAGSRFNVFVLYYLVSYQARALHDLAQLCLQHHASAAWSFWHSRRSCSSATVFRLVLENKREEVQLAFKDSLIMVFFLMFLFFLIAFFFPLTSLFFSMAVLPADTLDVSQLSFFTRWAFPLFQLCALWLRFLMLLRIQRRRCMPALSPLELLALNLALMRPVGFLAFPLSASLASIVNIAVLIRWLQGKLVTLNSLDLQLFSEAGSGSGWPELSVMPVSKQVPAISATVFPVLIATIFWAVFLSVFFYVGCRLLKIKEGILSSDGF